MCRCVIIEFNDVGLAANKGKMKFIEERRQQGMTVYDYITVVIIFMKK